MGTFLLPGHLTSVPLGTFSASLSIASSGTFALPSFQSIRGPISSTSTLGSLWPLFLLTIRQHRIRTTSVLWSSMLPSPSPAAKLIIHCSPSTSTSLALPPRKKSRNMDLARANLLPGAASSNAIPEKLNIGFAPTRNVFTPPNCASVLAVLSTTPHSSMSNTWPPKHRTNVIPCGRFLLWLAKHSKLVSFFCAKNSSDAASSNGWMALRLLKRCASGFLSDPKSDKRAVVRDDVLVPLSKRTFLSFSLASGARAARARAERAFLGLL